MRIPEKVQNTGSVFYDFEGTFLLPVGQMDSLRHIISPRI